jgi:YHS domain-containing protein
LGESLAASGKKNECIVTGGTGTIAVTFMGETFYVCCSGCRDAFNEEPAKYVAAFKEKKKK